MIDLQKEAEECSKKEYDLRTSKIPIPTSMWYREETAYKMFYENGFITGANSNFVKQQILQGKIDVLNEIIDDLEKDILKNQNKTLMGFYKEVEFRKKLKENSYLFRVQTKIREKLKQLQDDRS
jgi:hypothetical protein